MDLGHESGSDDHESPSHEHLRQGAEPGDYHPDMLMTDVEESNALRPTHKEENTLPTPTVSNASDPPPEPDHLQAIPYNLRENIEFDEAILDYVGVDHDATETYDPEQDNDREDYAPARKAENWDLNSYFRPRIDYGPREKIASHQHGRCNGLKLHVTLQLSKVSRSIWESDEGQKVAKILQRWPHSWPNDELYRDRPNFTELTVHSIRENRLRSRNRDLVFDELRWLNENGAWKDLTLGQPEFRGCKACYEFGADCSLIHGGKYPCASCVVDNGSCMLVKEPQRKAPCETCVEKRIICSFRTDTDHRGACKYCHEHGFMCIAGPEDGYTRTGPALDLPDGGVAKPWRRSKRNLANQQKQYQLSMPRARSASPEIIFVSSNALPIHHPLYGGHVEFAASTWSDGGISCDWCRDVSFGVAGPFRLTSVNGVAAATSHGRYRMCCACTFQRLEIVDCDHRTFQAMTLFPPAATSTPSLRCSVCYNAAEYRCSSPQNNTEDLSGCGAVLCATCRSGVEVASAGNLSAYIAQQEVMADHSAVRLRADANLLRRDGFMVRKLRRERAGAR